MSSRRINANFRDARAKVGHSVEHVARIQAAQAARMEADPKTAIMNAVSRGEITVDEGVRRMREVMGD